jgi:hypothetical protein
MKRFVRQSIIIAFFICGAYAQTGDLYVKPNSENIRKEPGGAKIGELTAGTRLEVLEKRPSWVRVQLTGWIWEKSLTSDSMMVDGFMIRASHILVGTEAEANQVLQELKKGASFEELAAKYSKDESSAIKGGDLGEFQRGDFLPEFENAVFRLKPAEVSGIVKTGLGYHIIKRTK